MRRLLLLASLLFPAAVYADGISVDTSANTGGPNTFTGAQTFNGDITSTGSLSINNNTTLGDTASDTITLNASTVVYSSNGVIFATGTASNVSQILRIYPPGATASVVIRPPSNNTSFSVENLGGSSMKIKGAYFLGIDGSSGTGLYYNGTAGFTTAAAGGGYFTSRTIAQLNGDAPDAAGTIVTCSNCTVSMICVSSGTGAGAWVEVADKTAACDD